MSPSENRFIYQKNSTYFAQTAGGLEDLAALEAQSLGAAQVTPGFRGFWFYGQQDVMYNINYQARLITRVLAPLFTFRCTRVDDIYRHAWKIDWTQLFGLDTTFAVFSMVSNSAITHSKFAALKLKDAIADKFRERRKGRRPDVDPSAPGIRFVLHINNNRATVHLDTSGDSLHMRGYRKKSVPAPMRETVAAAIIRMSRWNGEKPLYDPMCGSGTLLAEALMHISRVPAGYLRKRFGFEAMPDFSREVWNRVKAAADSRIQAARPGLISGSDISGTAVNASAANLAALPFGSDVTLTRRDFKDIEDLGSHVIVTNPPYGIRLKNKPQAESLITSLGDFLKQRCTGTEAYVYFGDRQLIKKVGLRTSFKKPLHSGGLDGRLCRYDLY